jgi:hypothetical protein
MVDTSFAISIIFEESLTFFVTEEGKKQVYENINLNKTNTFCLRENSSTGKRAISNKFSSPP